MSAVIVVGTLRMWIVWNKRNSPSFSHFFVAELLQQSALEPSSVHAVDMDCMSMTPTIHTLFSNRKHMLLFIIFCFSVFLCPPRHISQSIEEEDTRTRSIHGPIIWFFPPFVESSWVLWFVFSSSSFSYSVLFDSWSWNLLCSSCHPPG